MSLLSKDKIERIAFSKYLLAQSKIHKDKSAPTSSFAILILHDLVEIFLQVAVETHLPQLEKPRTKIIETLADALNKTLASGSAISILFMQRLNERRNGLKHATIFVNNGDIQNLYIETETFFKDFCQILFNLKPDEVSLVSMISNEKVRGHLQEAEQLLEKRNFLDSVVSTTKAYHYLQHKEREVGGNITGQVKGEYRRYSSIRARSMGTKAVGHELDAFSEMVEKDIKALYETVTELETIVRLGIDYKSYVKFKTLMPHIYLPNTKDKPDNLYFVELTAERRARHNFNADSARFCFDFMLNVSLELQALG